MNRNIKWVVLAAALLVAALVSSAGLSVKPPASSSRPLSSSPAAITSVAPFLQATAPKITWSVPELSQTMFPGTTKTVTLNFQSDQDLGTIAVVRTPSLEGISSTTPTSFASISANKSYQLSVNLTAPPEFQKRSFGGTIQIRNAGIPATAYAQPLAVKLQTDFQTYTSPSVGITFDYPPTWTAHALPSEPYFTAPPDVDVLDLSTVPASVTPEQMAASAIASNNCPPDSNGQPSDHVISSSNAGTLYVLWCSAASEDYNYIFLNAAGRAVRLMYHDNFDLNASERQKIVIFNQIISSLNVQ